MISRNEFDAYNKAVEQIGNKAASDVESSVLNWCAQNPTASVAEKREAAKLIMEGYVQGYDDIASEFAAEWYDHRAKSEGISLDQAITMAVYSPEKSDAVARYQAKKLAKGGDAAFAKACGEYAKNDAFRSLNETIIANVGRDRDKGARFARVPAGAETCTFCLMLASRGAVYHTRKTAGEFKHFHRHCDCKVVPGFEDDPDAELVEGIKPGEMREQWWKFEKIDATEGLSSAERNGMKHLVLDGGELPENVKKTNPIARMRKAGRAGSGWISAGYRLDAEVKANGFNDVLAFYEYLGSRRTQSELDDARTLGETILSNADATPKLYEISKGYLRRSERGIASNADHIPSSHEVPNWLSGTSRNRHAKKHAAEYGIDYRSRDGQEEYNKVMSEVIDGHDAIMFVDDIAGQFGQQCAVYFRGEDIAVVNLDKNVRVTLFKYEEGYSAYYTALWHKMRERSDS